ncbi:MAG: glycosyltransferase, partial [Acetobacteraceae bacterium]|nr:glycosyltransferase [Acetobacteraceae bacterium]
MSSPISPDLSIDKLSGQLAGFFDAEWYRSRYPDIEAAGADPLYHFVTWGAAEGRDPNRWFDSAWYLEHYPDVAASGMVALLHYFQAGAAELRNPHPRFDAVWYVDQHPEATANPLLHYVTVGAAQGWFTEKPINMQEYLPSTAAPFAAPRGIAVDVIIPAYRGLKQTRRCVESVLADDERPEGRVIVVDDKSPEPALSAWLDRLAAEGRILLIRNSHNAGFVASVNRGIQAAGDHDVALLNSDTEVPQGWLRRLSAQAYAKQRIASVSPFSNNATICGYPTDEGGPLPLGMTVQQIDAACQSVNAGRAVSVPTTVGFCMYIRRAALNDVGLFDEAAFGLGYGEENDFCLRAAARGWRNILACDTFVYHEGNVSFGSSAAQITAKNGDVLLQRWPNYARLINQHIALDAVGPFRFAVTAALLRQSRLPVLLMVLHRLGGGVQQHIDMLMERLAGRTHVLVMQATARGAAISLPALSSQPVLTLPGERVTDLVTALQSANVSRAHIHHLMGMDVDVRELLHRLQVPFDVTVHDYFAICPQVNLVTSRQSHYCTEPVIAACNACIADQPSHGARDIVSWRRQFAWQFLEAERVICPSEDVKARLTRYGLAGRAIVARHEATPPRRWPMHLPALKGRRLRVAILGVLADGKGSQTVFSLAEHTSPAEVEFHVVGYAE